MILAIGLFLNWSPFIQWKDNELVGKSWENVRILGVLQRIALAYFFASLIIYFTTTKVTKIICVAILLGYWLLCWWFGDKSDPFSLPGYFGTGVDKQILGASHMYKGEGVVFDPEGLTSTIAAIVQVILGYFTGKYIREKGKSAETSLNNDKPAAQASYKMLSYLLIAGVVLVFTAFCWDLVFPINKKIWTSSYVLYSTGVALMVLSILIYLIEFRQLTGAWSRFFDVFGKNPLFIFFLSGFLPRILALLRWVDYYNAEGKAVYTSPFPWFYEHVCKPMFTNLKNGSLFYAVCMILFYWLIVYFLDKKKIYIKV
jgi:predicted acyltransferase